MAIVRAFIASCLGRVSERCNCGELANSLCAPAEKPERTHPPSGKTGLLPSALPRVTGQRMQMQISGRSRWVPLLLPPVQGPGRRGNSKELAGLERTFPFLLCHEPCLDEASTDGSSPLPPAHQGVRVCPRKPPPASMHRSQGTLLSSGKGS